MSFILNLHTFSPYRFVCSYFQLQETRLGGVNRFLKNEGRMTCYGYSNPGSQAVCRFEYHVNTHC